jgi:hypothetical protein
MLQLALLTRMRGASQSTPLELLRNTAHAMRQVLLLGCMPPLHFNLVFPTNPKPC